MKSLIIIGTGLFCLFALAACSSSPLDREYSVESLKKDIKAIKASGELKEGDEKLLAKSVMRSMFVKEAYEGRTYRDILEEARKEQEEEAAEARAETAKAEARAERLGKVLSVRLADKGYEKGRYEDYITYEFAFENKSGMTIKAFRGRMVFYDLFDEEIKSLSLTYDEGLKPREKKAYYASTDYNQFDDEDKALRDKTLDQMKVVWEPERVLLEDGTTLE